MNIILTDMFVGWKSGTLGRLKFFLYSFFLMLISAAGIYLSLTESGNWLISLFNVLATLLNYYCGLLIMIKRYRELTRFPLIFALLLWGIVIGSLLMGSQVLAAIGLIMLLILYVAPGRY